MSFDLLRESFPTARKHHRCIWCGERIEVGTKYRHEISKFDGNMQNHKWHLECDADAAEYFNSGEGPEFSPHEADRPPPLPKDANG